MGDANATHPVFPPFIGNYITSVVSICCIVIGSGLLWYNTGSVTVNSDAQRSANYYIICFYYVWLTSVAILLVRTKNKRGACMMFYLLLGGLLFELIANNEIANWAYGNLWRIYSADITRLTSTPSSGDKTAVKSMLAGTILAQFGALLSVFSASYHEKQHFALRGTYFTLLAWVLVIPGVISLFTSNVCTLQSDNSSTIVYSLAWKIIDVSLGILTVQTIGVLFDVFEFVAAAMVIAGTNGIFLLGDMFTLQYQRSLFSDYNNSASSVTAGGVLCWLSTLVALAAGLLYFRKRAVLHQVFVPPNLRKHYMGND